MTIIERKITKFGACYSIRAIIHGCWSICHDELTTQHIAPPQVTAPRDPFRSKNIILLYVVMRVHSVVRIEIVPSTGKNNLREKSLVFEFYEKFQKSRRSSKTAYTNRRGIINTKKKLFYRA